MNLENIINEWSYRCPDGIVDIKDENKLNILQNIISELKIDIDIIKEIKASNLRKGKSFVLGADIGIFKTGETVTIKELIYNGDDIDIEMINDKGEKDTFTIDKNDDLEELNESSFIEED